MIIKLISTFPNSVSVSELLAVINLYFCGMYEKSNIFSTSSDTMQAEEHESTKIVVFIVFLPFLNCIVILGKFGSICSKLQFISVVFPAFCVMQDFNWSCLTSIVGSVSFNDWFCCLMYFDF